MTQIQQDPSALVPMTDRPTVLDPVELYNTIMERIEPDLTTDAVQHISDKYTSESSVDEKARLQRYKVALAKCQEQMQSYFQWLQPQIATYCRTVFKEAEKASRAQEFKILQELENIF